MDDLMEEEEEQQQSEEEEERDDGEEEEESGEDSEDSEEEDSELDTPCDVNARGLIEELMDKVSEFATLCDVEGCVVVYGEGEGPSQPEVWPSGPEAARVLARYNANRKLEPEEAYFLIRRRIARLQEQLSMARRENRERETALLLHGAVAGRRPGLAGISSEELASLRRMVETRLQSVRDGIERLRLRGQGQGDHTEAQAPQPQPQGCPVDVASAVGDPSAHCPCDGGNGSLGGGTAAAG